MSHTVAIITFPGSNCDHDALHAVDLTEGLSGRLVWHKDAGAALNGVDAVILPGGFSYGDYLRCGAIAQFSPIMDAVVRFANQGGPVLGICNGFQILTEVGLLPGALIQNTGLKFLCQDTLLDVGTRKTPFTTDLLGQQIRVPIAHMEGNYVADAETLDRLEAEGRVLFRYAHAAPNGSSRDIAGICNEAGNVVGLMPHPERVVESSLGGTDGRGFFTSLVEHLR